jgi:predicted RNase H-like nuclease (RuvC/YqgF family)
MCFSVSDEIRLRSEIKTAKAELQGYKEQMESNTKERDDFERQTKEKESNLQQKLDEERQRANTLTQELQRVKSRQLMAFSGPKAGQTPQNPASSPGRLSAISSLEMKQLSDELRYGKYIFYRKRRVLLLGFCFNFIETQIFNLHF